jgi:hypothetical protein
VGGAVASTAVPGEPNDSALGGEHHHDRNLPDPSGPVSSPSYATTGSNDVSGWAGWVVFAGIMLIMLGAFQAIEGLVVVFDEGY